MLHNTFKNIKRVKKTLFCETVIIQLLDFSIFYLKISSMHYIFYLFLESCQMLFYIYTRYDTNIHVCVCLPIAVTYLVVHTVSSLVISIMATHQRKSIFLL